MERAELAAWLRLALTPGVGNGAARKLLAAFGLPDRLFSQSPQALGQLLPEAQATALAKPPAGLDALVDATLAWQQGDDGVARRIVTLADAGYPQALLQLADPPLMLYLMGPAALDWPRSLAIVGSRNPTPQGLVNARQFARSFAEAGYVVVSGMALGVDAAAHEGALDAARPGQLATIAVVGTGLDRVYPKQNLPLAHRIAAQGLVVSEYTVGTPPLAQNFPRRNRLIAALSQGTVVVEAALQSGSLITARLANELGREVFAIPGSIHSPQARGCHALLKQGAKLVETAQDVLEELVPGGRTANARVADEEEPEGEADPIIEALGFDPVSLDALVARTGEAASTLQARLLELEMQGHVSRLAGGLFQRTASA